VLEGGDIIIEEGGCWEAVKKGRVHVCQLGAVTRERSSGYRTIGNDITGTVNSEPLRSGAPATKNIATIKGVKNASNAIGATGLTADAYGRTRGGKVGAEDTNTRIAYNLAPHSVGCSACGSGFAQHTGPGIAIRNAPCPYATCRSMSFRAQTCSAGGIILRIDRVIRRRWRSCHCVDRAIGNAHCAERKAGAILLDHHHVCRAVRLHNGSGVVDACGLA